MLGPVHGDRHRAVERLRAAHGHAAARNEALARLEAAPDYVTAGVPVSFYTVVEAARRRNEVAIGYRVGAHSNDAAKAYGVTVNPKKSETIALGPNDRVIVLAED